jgi:hypothetical protein
LKFKFGVVDRFLVCGVVKAGGWGSEPRRVPLIIGAPYKAVVKLLSYGPKFGEPLCLRVLWEGALIWPKDPTFFFFFFNMKGVSWEEEKE